MPIKVKKCGPKLQILLQYSTPYKVSELGRFGNSVFAGSGYVKVILVARLIGGWGERCGVRWDGREREGKDQDSSR